MKMDDDALRAAFDAHTKGQTKFTRRMAINISDMDNSSPRFLVKRLERMGLLKDGAWDWFQENGGFKRQHFEDARSSLVR